MAGKDATGGSQGVLPVAVIGLGRMGGPIADHIIGAGYHVRVFDTVPEKMEGRVACGAIAATSPADAAEGAAVVCVIVFDDDQATDVIAGATGVLRSLAADAVIAVHTTVRLETIRTLADRATPAGVTVLDAGISGGEPGAQAGTLLTFVGGPQAAVDQARPVLGAFSKEVVHAGPLGAGMALKLARNAAGYTMMAAVHEAMELCVRCDVDLRALEHAILETATFAQAMSPFAFGGPGPLTADAPAELREHMDFVDHISAKDIDAALDLAERTSTDVPVLRTVRAMFRRVARLQD